MKMKCNELKDFIMNNTVVSSTVKAVQIRSLHDIYAPELGVKIKRGPP
jgi:hypothetical protein